MDTEAGSERAAKVEPRSGLHHGEIRNQLDRILASPEFHATDKMRDFLRFVVDEKLAGRSHRLKGFTIAVEVFGRGEDFDANRDPIVRIQAGRLRRAIERYYLVGGVHDPILIDIPKGRYVPRFAARTAISDHRADPSARFAKHDTPRVDGPTLAVLPFENLTGDPEQLVLTEGLTEELATELTRFQDIAVISCRLGRQPAAGAVDPPGLAREVGARFVLKGAVRRDNETVKVSAQLIDTIDGRQIWADASSHPLEAGLLIATQEKIANNVVSKVASEFGIIARRLSTESRKKPPSDLRTYEAMLRYYSHQIEPSPESAATCFAALQAASETEPDYGPVWSALASLHCQMYTFDTPGVANPLDTALEYARRGVFLEPGSQLARMTLAYASYLAEESESFREESEIALALNPNSPYTVGAIGFFHAIQGEFDRGLALLDRAIAVCPCHPRWFHSGYVLRRMLEHDYEGALTETTKHLPFIGYWDDVVQAAMLGKLGRKDEAQSHVEAALEQKPDFAARARELMRRGLKIDALIDDLVDGLRAAGMPA
jgi:adenylate cyclase